MSTEKEERESHVISLPLGHEETIPITIVDPNNGNAAVNLTGKTVQLVVDNYKGVRKVFTASIINAVNGYCAITIVLADYSVLVAGEYPFELWIHDNGVTPRKAAARGTFIVEQTPQL
jgi:hypothetical protein